MGPGVLGHDQHRIYVLEPEVLRHVPTDRPYDFSKELFPLLLEIGRPIYGHVLDGYWQDIGNLDQFRQANFDALDGRVQLDIPGLQLRGNVWVSQEVDIEEIEGVVGPAFIGANCRIADGASVGAYSILSRGVTMREASRYVGSVVDAARTSAAAPSWRAPSSAADATCVTTCACTRASRSVIR